MIDKDKIRVGSVKDDLTQKPPKMPFLADNVPKAMREAPRWVGWSWKKHNGKWTKVPINLHNGKHAKSNDAKTWCDFPKAEEAAKTEFVDGIGFMLGDGFCGFDFDNCRDAESGTIAPDVLAYCQRLRTYGEVSPSGEGVKLFFQGTLPKGPCKNGSVEVYSHDRFFVVTGHRLDECTLDLAIDQTDLTHIYQELIVGPKIAEQQRLDSDLDDRELAIAALDALSPKRADDYQDWLLVGMALHAVDPTLIDEFDRFSRQSSKYSPECCALKWKSYNRSSGDSAVRLASLIFWAQQDTPGWTPPGRRPFTDLGNAERFARQHGDRVRYVPAWDKWLIWDGLRWRPDTTNEVCRLAQQTARSISDSKWRKASESQARLSAMTKVASTLQGIAIEHNILDSNPWLLNCTNGTIDLRTGELRPHDPADLLTKSTGILYPDGDFPTPNWDEFMRTTFRGERTLIEFVQRLIGYSAVGVTKEHILPIFWGSGSNGKSTLLNAILHTLGDYGVQAPRNFLMVRHGETHPTELTDLFGARFVSIAETQNGQQFDEGLVKMLTGGERIRARRMRQDFWEFDPTHTPFLATNHRPVVRGGDHGIWRRLVLIPFTATFVDAHERAKLPDAPLKDPGLTEKLKAEAPGILRWIVEGCLEWQRKGLNPPKSVLAATEEYREESDTFKRWFDDECVTNEKLRCKAGEAYQSYSDWCETFGEKPMSSVDFARTLFDHGFGKIRRNDGLHYLGFTIPDSQFDK
jgi:putative DNA primase/helicase